MKEIRKVNAYRCADRQPQRENVSKDDASLPTVSIYALMAQCVMIAIVEQKVLHVIFWEHFYNLTD